MKSKVSNYIRGMIGLGLACVLAPSVVGQVRTVTLGITTHCPYGVGGCFAEIKNGLDLPDAIAAFAKTPDTKAQTVDLHMRDTWVPDPDLFARNFTNMNVGVDVRGVEAVVDGALEKQGTNLVLRVHGTGSAIQLAPLTRTVQWNTRLNRPQEPTRGERKAFEKLVAQFKKQPGRVRVVGPLTNEKAPAGTGARQILEVRKFEQLREKS